MDEITVKELFESYLKKLELKKVEAPLFVEKGSGIQDNLNGVEKTVEFTAGGKTYEVVNSLAKWKRSYLSSNDVEGIYTDMRAIRPDEEVTAIHSNFVDQWDWERKIEDRSLNTLKSTVKEIYNCMYLTAKEVGYPLTENIKFIHSEDLLGMYPNYSRIERENAICKEHGSVFLIGIGGDLASGEPHDGRAPDYDDWSTPTSPKHKGLNGDIIVWNDVLRSSFELSSMGIRVDINTLNNQLKIRSCTDRLELPWHTALFDGEMVQTIGGGIGQSRLCMLLLRKNNIFEVQAQVF